MFVNKMTEWQSIVSSSPTQSSYGSCVRSGRKPTEPTCRHYIEDGDTLPGIAVKYGTTTEELRRLNKLYYTDSVLLRKFLVIPASRSKPGKDVGTVTPKSEKPVEKTKPENVSVGARKSKRVPVTNGTEKDYTNDAQSFLQKLDMQISAGKKAACTIISDPSFETLTMPTPTSSRLIRRKSSFERTTATKFSDSDKLLNNEDEDLFHL